MSIAAHPASPQGFATAFVASVLDDALARGTRLLGISGVQGSGKSTLAAQIVAAARARGLRSTALSIDDFYLDRPQRQRLARDVHPLLATRGPPGTHDVALAHATLDALRAGRTVRIPVFDKLSDRRLPASRWRGSNDDNPGSGPGQVLVVFEGWCLGTPPQREDELVEPINTLERDEDRDGAWRRFCNDALARDYPALWRRIDRLLFLQPPSFDIVPAWRWQQEHSLKAKDPSHAGMTFTQLERFVQHYERVSRQALQTLPALADITIPLDVRRRPAARPVA